MSFLSVGGANSGLNSIPRVTPSADSTPAASTGALHAATSSRRRAQQHGASQFFGQLQQAVTSALRTAQSSGKHVDTDQTIRNAVTALLKQSSGGGPGAIDRLGTLARGAAPGSRPVVSAVEQPAASNSSKSSPGDVMQAFYQKLQSYGVSPEQFRGDFRQAIQQARGGNIDVSQALASIPAGAGLDVTA